MKPIKYTITLLLFGLLTGCSTPRDNKCEECLTTFVAAEENAIMYADVAFLFVHTKEKGESQRKAIEILRNRTESDLTSWIGHTLPRSSPPLGEEIPNGWSGIVFMDMVDGEWREGYCTFSRYDEGSDTSKAVEDLKRKIRKQK